MTTISFQTSCYQNSYEKLLKNGLLEYYLNLFYDIPFLEKTVIINNIKDIEQVKKLIENYPDINFYYSYGELLNVLPYFNLSSWDFPIGPYYSIHHFVGMYYTKSDYLFHISEDCNIGNLDTLFVKDCIDILESSDEYISAMPRWGIDPEKGAIEEAIKIDRKFIIALTFTDQIYIAKTKVFKQDIYHFEHTDSEKYPSKGGNSFERRVNSYMWANNKYRAIHKDYFYLHEPNK